MTSSFRSSPGEKIKNDLDFLFGGGVIDDQQLFGQPLAKSAVRPDDKVNRHDGQIA